MQVCAYRATDLRKAITKKRREMKIVGSHGRGQLRELLVQHGGLAEAEGDTDTLRQRWAAVRKDVHRPVTRMSVTQAVQYMYRMAAEPFNWNWGTVLTQQGQKQRVSKRCRRAPGIGEVSEAPAGALPKPRNDLDVPRPLSTYQQHMSNTMRRLKTSQPDMSHKERFAEAVRLWRREKNIARTKASIERGRQMRQERDARRARQPAASDDIETVPAPRKRAAARPRRTEPRGTIRDRSQLTPAQERAIREYNPRRNRQRLKQAVRINMMQGMPFEQARRRAENPIGVQTDAADSNLDLIAGSGAPKKKPLSMADV